MFGCKQRERNIYECNLRVGGEGSPKDLFQDKESRQMDFSRRTEKVTEVKVMKQFGERKG